MKTPHYDIPSAFLTLIFFVIIKNGSAVKNVIQPLRSKSLKGQYTCKRHVRIKQIVGTTRAVCMATMTSFIPRF